MTTVIMLFILPLGIMLFIYDKKVLKQSEDIYFDYIEDIKKSELSDEEKILKIDAMFYENNYKSTFRDKQNLKVEHKHFNLGLLFIFFGVLNYFGIIFYTIYYKFFSKPIIYEVNL